MRAVAGEHGNVSFAARWRHKDARHGFELAADVGHAMPTSTLESSRPCSHAAGARSTRPRSSTLCAIRVGDDIEPFHRRRLPRALHRSAISGF